MSCVLRMDLCFNFRDKGEDHSRGENDLRLKDKHHRKVKIKIEKVQSEVISFFSYHLLREKQYFSGKPPLSPERARESEDCGVRRGACLREPCPLRGWSCPLPNFRDPSPRSNEDEETEQERALGCGFVFVFSFRRQPREALAGGVETLPSHRRAWRVDTGVWGLPVRGRGIRGEEEDGAGRETSSSRHHLDAPFSGSASSHAPRLSQLAGVPGRREPCSRHRQ